MRIEAPPLCQLPLLPEQLSKDFSSGQERTRRIVQALYSCLMAEPIRSRPSYEQWFQSFSVATEYEQREAKLEKNAAVRKSLDAFGVPRQGADLGCFVFAIHTFFAILAKLLAFTAIARQDDSPALALKKWSGLVNGDFAERFREL